MTEAVESWWKRYADSDLVTPRGQNCGPKNSPLKKNVLVSVISSCFWVEITDSDVKFGTSATIYFEKRSSWAILAVFKPFLVLILTYKIQVGIFGPQFCPRGVTSSSYDLNTLRQFPTILSQNTSNSNFFVRFQPIFPTKTVWTNSTFFNQQKTWLKNLTKKLFNWH